MPDVQPIVIRKGRLLNSLSGVASFKDLFIQGGVIREIGEPSLNVSSEVKVIDASNMLLIPDWSMRIPMVMVVFLKG